MVQQGSGMELVWELEFARQARRRNKGLRSAMEAKPSAKMMTVRGEGWGNGGGFIGL